MIIAVSRLYIAISCLYDGFSRYTAGRAEGQAEWGAITDSPKAARPSAVLRK